MNDIEAARLFRHVSTERAASYRAIMDRFAAAKRQYSLHLRSDDILHGTRWPGEPPTQEELDGLLAQLVEWGNLEAQPDTARVATIEDFYRKRLLYRLTRGGEAVEAGLAAFAEALSRQGELQSVALDDILARLAALAALAREPRPDAAKVHETLRDLAHVFAGLADNAEAFMTGLQRTIELQRAEQDAVMAFKARLIDYLERFIGELVVKSGRIAQHLRELQPRAGALLALAAQREAQDAAPGDAGAEGQARERRLAAWRERWTGLMRWFVADGREKPQAELLRASARAAIPRLLQAVSTLNERRAGRSDRAADFRRLALWFAACPDAGHAHRLWRAAFALSPARHLALVPAAPVAASTSWREAPPIAIHPRLRETGRLATRGGPAKIRERGAERAQLAARLAEETAQTEAARRRLTQDGETRLSALGALDRHAFRLFLALLGDALAAQKHPDDTVERATGDGSLLIRLEPLEPGSRAEIDTELGVFRGRDHRLLIRELAP